jgi:hypothetical protein
MRKWTKYKCNNCWTLVIDSWVWFEPFIHNIDTWHSNLEKCWYFVKFDFIKD